MLFSMLLNSASAQVTVVENASGKRVPSASPASAGQLRQSQSAEKIAEGYVFPLSGARRRPRARAERILTGIFSASGTMETQDPGATLPDRLNSDSSSATRKKSVKQQDTIAWITREGLLYHDPFLECPAASGSERVWVDDYHELSGLQPCNDCFQKNNNIPDFIQKESGGLDVASATSLMANADFLAWAQERLPIRNPGFISTQKLVIYPKMEMTAKGLHQLARETEMAYRRMTWKVIEVLGKHSEIDTGNLSSFDDEVAESAVTNPPGDSRPASEPLQFEEAKEAKKSDD